MKCMPARKRPAKKKLKNPKTSSMFAEDMKCMPTRKRFVKKKDMSGTDPPFEINVQQIKKMNMSQPHAQHVKHIYKYK